MVDSSRGDASGERVIRIDWGEREGRRRGKAGVKGRGPTPGPLWNLPGGSAGEVSGIPSVAVKCVDIRRKTSGEGGLLDRD